MDSHSIENRLCQLTLEPIKLGTYNLLHRLDFPDVDGLEEQQQHDDGDAGDQQEEKYSHTH